MPKFCEKAVVVTGASEGIGRALCKTLAAQGAWLTLAARNQKRLEELAAEVEDLGGKARVRPTDVTDRDACAGLIEDAVEKWGRLDALVANAGRTIWTRFEDIEDLEIFEKIMRLNYFGALYCAYYALPHLKAAKGMIVAVSSVAGVTGTPERTAYSASKHAMFGLFDSLRVELKDTGVTVTMAAPDFVASEIHRRALGQDGAPLGESPVDYSTVMSANQCARLIVRGMESRKRVVLGSARTKFAYYFEPFVPGAIADWIKTRAMEKAAGK